MRRLKLWETCKGWFIAKTFMKTFDAHKPQPRIGEQEYVEKALAVIHNTCVLASYQLALPYIGTRQLHMYLAYTTSLAYLFQHSTGTALPLTMISPIHANFVAGQATWAYLYLLHSLHNTTYYPQPMHVSLWAPSTQHLLSTDHSQPSLKLKSFQALHYYWATKHPDCTAVLPPVGNCNFPAAI